MITLKAFKKWFTLQLFGFMVVLSLSSNGLAQNVAPNTIKNNDNIKFYEFVVNEYVDLIKSVYEGDNPFFIIIENLYVNEDIPALNIKLTYTTFHKKLIPYIGSDFYKFSEDSNIYVILTKDYENANGEFEFKGFFQTRLLTEKILNEQIYPLTEDYYDDMLIQNSTDSIKINYSENFFYDNDIYTIYKYKDKIESRVNGRSIVYFKNYFKR